MTNFQVYKKTLSFSFLYFGLSLISFAILVGFCFIGYYIGKPSDKALLGLAIGLVVGIIEMVAFSYLVLNRVKAAWIAMMVKGVADGELPDHVVKSGFVEVKGRFAKITAFFVVTNLIKGCFRQIGRGINKLGTMVGGDAGNAVTSVIDTGIQILLEYLCDCCLGWVMYRKDQGVTKSACEGAVIFFKHGKTLARNVGRIFGMGLLSLVVVGGALFGGLFALANAFPSWFVTLGDEIAAFAQRVDWKDMPTWIHDPKILGIVVAAIAAVVLWSMIHSVVGRPFILVGVLRNFVAAGKKEMPKEEDFKLLESKSPKFKKLLEKEI